MRRTVRAAATLVLSEQHKIHSGSNQCCHAYFQEHLAFRKAGIVAVSPVNRQGLYRCLVHARRPCALPHIASPSLYRSFCESFCSSCNVYRHSHDALAVGFPAEAGHAYACSGGHGRSALPAYLRRWCVCSKQPAAAARCIRKSSYGWVCQGVPKHSMPSQPQAAAVEHKRCTSHCTWLREPACLACAVHQRMYCRELMYAAKFSAGNTAFSNQFNDRLLPLTSLMQPLASHALHRLPYTFCCTWPSAPSPGQLSPAPSCCPARLATF